MQKHVVVARFDEKTDALFTKWKGEALELQLKRFGASAEWPPHLTVAAYEGVPVDALCDWVCEYAGRFDEIDIRFGSLGVFAHGATLDTDVIYAAPANSAALTDFYYGFHEKLSVYCGDYGRQYTAKFGYPIFHSTLALCKASEFNRLFDDLRGKFCGVAGKIIALEVYENPMRLIGRYPLERGGLT